MTGREENDRHVGLTNTDRAWPPRLGDLVRDLRRHCLAVVVALPGDHGQDALTYHLTPPGGGTIWSVPGDASTLAAVRDNGPPLVRFAVPRPAKTVCRPGTDQAALPIRSHTDDGTTQDTIPVLATPQVRRCARHLAQAAPAHRRLTSPFSCPAARVATPPPQPGRTRRPRPITERRETAPCPPPSAPPARCPC